MNRVHDAPGSGGSRFAPIVYLRNAHPKQTVYLPVAAGWCRVLRPAVTTCVPERVLQTPVVRELLTRRLLDLVDGAAFDADVRQRRARRTDMTRAIAAAEQVEFDRLLSRRPDHAKPRRAYRRQDKRLRKRRDDQWTPEQLALLRRHWAAGVRADVIAAALGRTAGAVSEKAKREGLQRGKLVEAVVGHSHEGFAIRVPPSPAAAPGAT